MKQTLSGYTGRGKGPISAGTVLQSVRRKRKGKGRERVRGKGKGTGRGIARGRGRGRGKGKKERKREGGTGMGTGSGQARGRAVGKGQAGRNTNRDKRLNHYADVMRDLEGSFSTGHAAADGDQMSCPIKTLITYLESPLIMRDIMRDVQTQRSHYSLRPRGGFVVLLLCGMRVKP